MKEWIIELDEPIDLFCVAAASFPEGITGAFESLQAKLASIEGRTFYGISWMTTRARRYIKRVLKRMEPVKEQNWVANLPPSEKVFMSAKQSTDSGKISLSYVKHSFACCRIRALIWKAIV